MDIFRPLFCDRALWEKLAIIVGLGGGEVTGVARWEGVAVILSWRGEGTEVTCFVPNVAPGRARRELRASKYLEREEDTARYLIRSDRFSI